VISPGEILQGIALGVSGWTLLEVISLGKKVASLETKVSMLPCDKTKDPCP